MYTSLSFTLSLLLLPLLFCSPVYSNPNNGTESLHFNWAYLNSYGGQNLNTDVLKLPYDFILSQNNTSLFVSDMGPKQIKQFSKNIVDSYSVVFSDVYPYSLEQIGQNSLAVGSNNVRIYNNNYPLSNVSFDRDFELVVGLCYNDIASTLYVADPKHSRVVAINISTNGSGELLFIYGKSKPEDLYPMDDPKMENMGYPTHMRLDCVGNLWVVDSMFKRIVRYKAGTTTPDIMWGQSYWNKSISQTTQEGYSNPQDIVFDKSCSVAFVADGQRVLLYRAPFVPFQSAEGVLGANNLTSQGSFGTIRRLQLEDIRDGIGLLYILDANYSRIVVGATQWKSTSTFDCSSPSSVVDGECVIQQAVALEGVAITLPVNYTTIVIGDILTMDNDTQLKMREYQLIKTSGNITLAGQLTLILSTDFRAVLQQEGGIVITLLTTDSNLNGKFSAVTIEGEEEQNIECEVIDAAYTGRSMGVVLTVNKGCIGGAAGNSPGKSLNNGAIAGIVVGVAGAVVIIIVVVSIVGGIIAWRVKKTMNKTLEDSQGLSL